MFQTKQPTCGLGTITLLLGCFFSSPSWAMLVPRVPSVGDAIFYTAAFSAVLFSALVIWAYRQPQWLIYCVFAILLLFDAAALDGSLAHQMGGGDFVTWLVPFLIHAGVAAFGFCLVALRIDPSHRLGRFRPVFFGLALLTFMLPLSTPLWLYRIDLSLMWVPVNVLFVLMVLSQALPPLTWQAETPRQRRFMQGFPVVVGLFTLASIVSQSLFVELSADLQIGLHRMALMGFGACALVLVIWQAFARARAAERAEYQALKAAKQQAETQLALLQAQQDYEQARKTAQQHRMQLATVSHDLKQPIAALRMAIDTSPTLATHSGANPLASAVDYIDQLARAYLPADQGHEPQAKAAESSTPKEPAKEQVSTTLFVQTLGQMFAEEAQKQGVELRFRNRPAWLWVEPLSMMRMMTNLISNALKHASATRVLVGFRRCGDLVLFQVHDNGCGIDSNLLDQALEPGTKGLNSKGQGLGLSIVQNLCQAQGLGFQIQSVVGAGASVTIELPVANHPEPFEQNAEAGQ